jgi:hypothetical protein
MTRRDTITPEMATALRAIVLTTGDLDGYQPMDIAFTTVIAGRLETEPAEAAFENARDQLRRAAVALGGDAVIHCRFEHTVYGDPALYTVHGYGTVAKRR